MKSLYLLVDLFSISVPLIFSFHPRLKLSSEWKYLFPAIIISMIPYIVWDVYFTDKGYWGFNPEYLQGIYLFKLPIEEWLFFICIPYACIFTHYSLKTLLPKFELSKGITKSITLLLFLFFTILIVVFSDRAYTTTVSVFSIFILLFTYILKRPLLNRYYLTFLIILIPFFIVNGILTGSGITDQVVWYNDAENIGIRILTIPIEDSLYAFSLILLNLFLFEVARKHYSSRKDLLSTI